MSEHLLQPRHREILDSTVLMQLQTLLQHPKQEAIWDSFHLLDCVHFHATNLSPSTSQAIHAALWTLIQSLHEAKKYDQAIPWCQLALHPSLTTSCPASNPGKFLRRILSAHISLDDVPSALALVDTLPDATRNDLVTQFLLFRLAIRTWNQPLAQRCLQFLATQSGGEGRARDALYACVREAQRAGDRLCTVAALTAAAATWKDEVVVPANLPALLRCAIRLLQMLAAEEAQVAEPSFGVASSNSTADEMGLHVDIVAAEFVASNARDENGDAVFHAAELRWFSTNAYNFGVVHCTTWGPGRLASLFKSCLVFTQALFSSEADTTDDSADSDFTILRCHFILASLYISEARIIKNEHTSSLYADVEQHTMAFTKLFVSSCGAAVDQYPDFLQKLGILCVFQFEALLFRHSYKNLPCIITQARLCSDANVLKALGGCLIQSEAPVQVKSTLLKSIINETFTVEDFKSDRLAQYLRCIVQALLPMADDGAAREVLDQAIQVAEEAKQVSVGFPAEEAEWLAAAAFNHGLTKYAARQDMATCQAWVDRAVAMAQHADDSGQLAASIQQRRQTLLNSSLTSTL